ncbi:MAG TPA: helix-turn-helix domain-containing protein, partial [Candidatus Cybelea sp.]
MPRAQPSASPPVAEFGTLLKRLRVQAGISQEQLAERARISAKTVGAYERGDRRAPYRDTLALIVAALGITGAACDELEAAADEARRRGPRAIERSSAGEFTTHLTNLPSPRTTFVGRDRELADVKDLIERYRLLTLVGSGGVGKTRLAVAVGAELLDRFPDGVWFVDFAPIRNPELVSSVVARALGMSQHQDGRVDEAIAQWLKRKHLLLIFDNCEHVVEHSAALGDAVLAAAHGVRILATSRQALEVSGEAVHRLRPLAVPADAAGLTTDEVLNYGAVALFVDRATDADTGFALTDDGAPTVAEICRRLDGIPLAIELAAARVKVLSLPNLAQRLNDRFTILTRGSRNALPRQKTLTALIDWSYDLLTAQEQLLFARLGIFSGSFGFDAVTAVCGADGLDGIDIFDLLALLTDKSLVVADTSGERERYRLLESTAAYALERLRAFGERERLTRRHAEYFREQAQAADARTGSNSPVAWLAQVELELDNYRAVLEWTLTQGNDAVLGGTIAGALGRLWWLGGLPVEGRHWIELALTCVSEAEHPAIAARLQLALSTLHEGKRSKGAAERALQLYESLGDARGAVRARRRRGFALFQMGRLDEAREATANALAASRASGETWDLANTLNLLALIENRRGDLRAGRDLYAQALLATRALGDELGISRVLGNKAELEFAAGDVEQALLLANEALELPSLEKHLRLKASCHNNAAIYRTALGDIAGAGESAREGLRLARQIRHELYIANAFQHLALLAALGGDTRCGAQLLGYADALHNQLGVKRGPTEQWGYDKLLAELRERLSEDEITRLVAEGAAWSEDQAVEAEG